MKNLIIVLLASGMTLAANAQTVHSHTTVSTQQNPDGSTHTVVNHHKHVTVRHRARTPRVTVKKTTTTTSATVK